MSFSNNPQSAYNGMMSGHRNMFLLSTVSIAMIGFVKQYENIYFMVCASFLFLIAAYIGVSSSLDFAYYIKHNNPPASVYNIENWKKWKYIGYIYAIFLVVLSIYSIILVIQS